VNPTNFFAELKRRNVYKVAIAYAVVAWLLMQVASQIFPFFEIPNWAVRLVVLLLIIGFPIALIIAWAFELTPEGLKRTEAADREGAKPSLVPVIEIAMLEPAGGTRGADTNEIATLKESWKGIPVQNFSSVSELQAWEKNWPSDGGRPAAKIVYDPAVGEVRVSGRSQGRVFQKTFHYSPLAIGTAGSAGRSSWVAMHVKRDLATTLRQAKAFIREQTKR
jgi:hypothetical protein